MSINTTATMTADMQTFYDRRFLKKALLSNQFYKFAQKRPLPKGEGKTVNFTRFLPLATRTTALTETTTGGVAAGSGSSLSSMTVSATVAPYGNFAEIANILSLTSIDRGMKEKVDVLGLQASETIDELCRNEFSVGVNRVRADGDANYTVDFTTTSAGTTTTVVSTLLTQTDDYWNGAYVICTDRTNKAYGEVKLVSDFTNSTGTLTCAAFSTAPGTGAACRVVHTTGIVATDKMTYTNLMLTKRELRRQHAMKYDGGNYIMLLDPDQMYDFMTDTTLTGLSQQSKPGILEEGEVARFGGFRIFEQSSLWREAAATGGTYSATGAVHVAMGFGAEALGVVDLAGQGKKIYVMSPQDLGQPVPLYWTIGWHTMFAPKTVNGCFGVGLCTGATA